jgi:hypothetical protein
MNNLINKSLSSFVNFPFSASVLFNLELREKFLRLFLGIFLLNESIRRIISLKFSYFRYETEILVSNSLVKNVFNLQRELKGAGVAININRLLMLASVFYSDKKGIEKVASVIGSQGASLNSVYSHFLLNTRLSYYIVSAFKDVEAFDKFFELIDIKSVEKRALIQKFFQIKEMPNSSIFAPVNFVVNYLSQADFRFLISNILFISSKFKNNFAEFGPYFFSFSNEIFNVSDGFSKNFKLNVIAPSFQYNRNIFDEWAVLYRKGRVGAFETLNETNVNTFFYSLRNYLSNISLKEQVDFLDVGDFARIFFANLYSKKN